MADEPEDDDLLEAEPLEPDEDEQQDDDPNVNDEDDEETVLTFGDAAEGQEGDSGLVKHLRDELKRARKAEAEARRSTPRDEPIEVGEEPDYGDGAEYGYDHDAWLVDWKAWNDRKAKKDAQAGQSADVEETHRKEWEGEISRYNEGKVKLGFADVDEAEENIKAALTTVQQAVLVKATNDPAKVMYALGKHPDRLAAVAAIHDPLKLAAELARLEGQLKMTKRKRAPDPEKVERGSGKVSQTTSDKKLKKLEEEAERTGDRTALISYKKQQAAK